MKIEKAAASAAIRYGMKLYKIIQPAKAFSINGLDVCLLKRAAINY